jgi:hypothetical protein
MNQWIHSIVLFWVDNSSYFFSSSYVKCISVFCACPVRTWVWVISMLCMSRMMICTHGMYRAWSRDA